MRVTQLFFRSLWVVFISLMLTASQVVAQEEGDLVKKMSNPVSSLISVPLEFDYDQNIGPIDNGNRYSFTAKPVIPITLNEDWNLISRTILPLVIQNDIFPGAGDQTGLGDILQSFFFSPAEPTASGIIWGLGPAILLPTATDDLLGADTWAAGPNGIVLVQKGPWTIGMLVNHLWDFAGSTNRIDISSTFMQPFLSYSTPTAWTFSLNTESSYSWISESWSVPINFGVSKLTKFGKQPVQLKGGLRYWAESPAGGPEGWGFKLGIVFLFPK